MNHPFIIAVMGAPRTGKSYLAKKLAEHYSAQIFLEEGEGYPERIQENLANNIRPLERQLWFRTQCARRHLEAKQLQAQGVSSILDIFWLSAHLYIQDMTDPFERELLYDVSTQDEVMLGYPDVIIYLKQSAEGIRDFVSRGGRAFDASERYYQEVILPSFHAHESYLAEHGHKMNLISLDRTGLDFKDRETFHSIVTQIDASLVV